MLGPGWRRGGGGGKGGLEGRGGQLHTQAFGLQAVAGVEILAWLRFK